VIEEFFDFSLSPEKYEERNKSIKSIITFIIILGSVKVISE